jgi:hypothetical protein
MGMMRAREIVKMTHSRLLLILGLFALAAFIPRIVRRVRAAGPGETVTKHGSEVRS